MPAHIVITTRHAEAASHALGNDSARPLTKDGVAQARALGQRLASALSELDTVFVSPAVRAQETWENMAQGAGLTGTGQPRVCTAEVIYDGSPEQILALILRESTGRSTMVVGHEPTISALAFNLVRPGEAKEIEWGMPTGSSVIVEYDAEWGAWHDGCATLTEFIRVPAR